jgi:hypothetical protein
MTFQKGNKIGHRFTNTDQPPKEKVGRKPALYKQLLAVTGKKVNFELSKEDYLKIIRYLMERSKDELTLIFKDSKTPIFICNIIGALFADTKYGRTTTVEALFDRLFGKALIVTENTVKEADPLDGATEEELLQEIQRIKDSMK